MAALNGMRTSTVTAAKTSYVHGLDRFMRDDVGQGDADGHFQFCFPWGLCS